MKSCAQSLIDLMLEYLLTQPKVYRVRRFLLLKRGIAQYKEQYGNNRTYQLKRIACLIVQTEFHERDNPIRRDMLIDL